MSKLSQSKVIARWEPSKDTELRNGQKELLDYLRENRKSKYSCQLPTGYGKSWCACISYAVLKDLGIVDRCLIIVPTDQQRTQYVLGLPQDMIDLGIEYRGVERCDNQSPWVIKQSFSNKSDVFVAGIGSIVSSPGYYQDLMSKGRWLVVADEFHHYGSKNTWGKKILELSYEVILGMSATPFRGDKTQTIFGDEDFDVSVSIKDAFKEKAIRPVKGVVSDYVVSWSSIENQTPQNTLMSEIESEWGSDISEYELKKGVRYHDKYVSSIFNSALSAWLDYESRNPGQNQILVFAMTCAHAESIAKTINDLAFQQGISSGVFADWVGVGEGVKDEFGNANRKSGRDNESIIKSFQNNTLKCLVQVNKAGEGFNNKRCSIGVFLDLIGDTPQKRQHIGRFMRVNPDCNGNDPSLIFISEDSPCKALLENMEESFGLPSEDSETEGGDGIEKSKQLVIPDIWVIDTRKHSERVVYPFGSPEAALSKYLESASPHVRQAYSELDKDTALSVFKSEFEAFFRQEEERKNPGLSSEERRKQIINQVDQHRAMVVSHVVKLRFGKSCPKSAFGDFHKLINGRWKKVHGFGHSDMTEEDLRMKNEWLKQLAKEINEKGIPTWLNV